MAAAAQPQETLALIRSFVLVALNNNPEAKPQRICDTLVCSDADESAKAADEIEKAACQGVEYKCKVS